MGFKYYWKVEHRTDPSCICLAPVKKSIYNLGDPTRIFFVGNRYLAALNAFFHWRQAAGPVTRP